MKMHTYGTGDDRIRLRVWTRNELNELRDAADDALATELDTVRSVRLDVALGGRRVAP